MTYMFLVPQVYVKVQPGDLDDSGVLLAGKDANINLSGDLTNSGTIYGRNVVNLTAENVNRWHSPKPVDIFHSLLSISDAQCIPKRLSKCRSFSA